ncbi:MAG: hypothetical protein AAGE52_41185 [Myxococcota bacterium]
MVLALACGDDAAPLEDAGVDTATGEDAGDAGFDAGLPPLDLPPLEAANAITPAEGEEVYQGMIRFLWDNWGVEVLDEWPPAEFMLQLMADEPEVFGNQYESFGFLPDPNDDFPVGFKRGLEDETLMHETCALCHVGELPDGRIWIGAPNTRLRFGDFRVEVNQRWVAAGNAPLISDLTETKARAFGPGRTSAESRDFPQVIPVDFPPYWNLSTTPRLNYLGTSRNVRSEVYLGMFAFGAGRPNPEEAVVPFPDRELMFQLVSWFEVMRSPVGPSEDDALVSQGRALFERERCTSCHNDDPSQNPVAVYSPDGVERIPGDDPMFEDGTIATSELHRTLLDGDGGPDEEARADFIDFILRNRLAVGMSDGYRTPQLTGTWATAPYLHNGSVPTLEDLLRPVAERPTVFDRHGFTVDTAVAGNSNEGHEFGTTITEEERTALVAYLRSL